LRCSWDIGSPSILISLATFRLTQRNFSLRCHSWIASLLDLAGTKASVVQVRAEAKDYLDLDMLVMKGGISLPSALAAAQALYGASFNPQITLKALSYFEDGDLRTLPEASKSRLSTAARCVDLDHLPALNSLLRGKVEDQGLGS
jgi:hypothetical protein